MQDVLTDHVPAALPGLALVEAIEQEARRQGIDARDLHARFEIQPGYWNTILGRNRSIDGFARARLELVADFLQMPVVQVMALAEIVRPTDFVVRSTLSDQLNAAFLKFRADPHWASIAPSPEEWDITPVGVQLALVLLYERFFTEQLIAKARIPHVFHVATPGSDHGSVKSRSPVSASVKASASSARSSKASAPSSPSNVGAPKKSAAREQKPTLKLSKPLKTAKSAKRRVAHA